LEGNATRGELVTLTMNVIEIWGILVAINEGVVGQYLIVESLKL
jgi:hypothetical protein